MSVALSALKRECVSVIRQHPSLFFPIFRVYHSLGGPEHAGELTSDSDLVIEGFFRCGNSFATRAFLEAQRHPVKIANRTHAPATVIRAIEWHLPILVLAREPLGTILSLLLKHPQALPDQSLRHYAQFYRRLEPLKGSFVVATFEEVITDYGQVIARLNDRFGTDFDLFVHSEESVKRVFARIRSVDERVEGGDKSKFSIPTTEKEQRKAILKEVLLQDRKFVTLLTEAERVYQAFVAPDTSARQLTRSQNIVRE